MYYTYSDANACVGTDSINFMISECVGLNTVSSSASEIKLYPNPAHETITVVKSSSGIVNLSISDASGRILFNKQLQSAKEIIDLSKFSNGVYLVSLKNEMGKTERVIKLIKE